jgi:hypothetical protein
MLRIGLISDTHGLLRPQVKAYLHASDCIIHAGDICGPEILAELESIAPVTAVRGNNDKVPWAQGLKEIEILHKAGVIICVVHDLATLAQDPVAAGLHVVVSGHSHKPQAVHRQGVLYVNPGSAGPRRFSLPIAAGELLIADGRVTAHLREFPRDG